MFTYFYSFLNTLLYNFFPISTRSKTMCLYRFTCDVVAAFQPSSEMGEQDGRGPPSSLWHPRSLTQGWVSKRLETGLETGLEIQRSYGTSSGRALTMQDGIGFQ